MRNNLFIISTIACLVLAFLGSCKSNTGTYSNSRNTIATQRDTVRIANDSLEYEIIIIEPGFYSWLATQPPQGYYTQNVMDITNDRKIREYNLRVNSPMSYDSSLYVFNIEYDRTIDYGYEVTYLLYNYFRFFEQRYNQRL